MHHLLVGLGIYGDSDEEDDSGSDNDRDDEGNSEDDEEAERALRVKLVTGLKW